MKKNELKKLFYRSQTCTYRVYKRLFLRRKNEIILCETKKRNSMHQAR